MMIVVQGYFDLLESEHIAFFAVSYNPFSAYIVESPENYGLGKELIKWELPTPTKNSAYRR